MKRLTNLKNKQKYNRSIIPELGMPTVPNKVEQDREKAIIEEIEEWTRNNGKKLRRTRKWPENRARMRRAHTGDNQDITEVLRAQRELGTQRSMVEEGAPRLWILWIGGCRPRWPREEVP